ncbi:MAG: DUF547 domain-containing protein [Bacteroidetes bacterium HGW-Bacteroidetes-3]|jgi:hypothetical protein|nr:MAG: DUF547 domain-containing protein [Bacteroidetes bacterium HGW-Bacteroidetes-3]
MANKNSLLLISEELLLHVKMKADTNLEEMALKNRSIIQLQNELKTDDAKKSFWINVYNAYFQLLIGKYKGQRKGLFSKKEIFIAQTRFSLDDIEHGILRKYTWKWSFGYIPDPFVSLLTRNLAVEKTDYRIHFALNCGAKSCPPIAFYIFNNIDKQLNDAMFSFLISETTINNQTKIINTSKLLYWYKGDFGGSKGIKTIISKVFESDLTKYKLVYNKYNWESQLENYTN